MFFSVIVPVYNAEKYLCQCLDSLADQTCTDKEVIVVDDGSTDSSGDICDEYARKYAFVTVIHQENQGVSAARNAGLAVANGEWISFVNSDDWVDTDMLELLQGYILVTNADLYCFGYRKTNEDGIEEEDRKPMGKHTICSIKDEQERFRFYSVHCPWRRCVWEGVYRHSIIQKHKLKFVKVPGDDSLFNYQYSLHIRRVVFLNYSPYYYRQKRGSLSHVAKQKQILLQSLVVAEHAYQAIVESGMAYFQNNFHKHYFKMLNPCILYLTKYMDDAQIRQILDEMCEQEFHHRNIKKIHRQKRLIMKQTNGRVWFSKRFGRKEKSQLSWAIWILWQNINYMQKHKKIVPLSYYMDKEQQVAYLVNFKAACSSVQVSMLRRSDIPDDYSIFRMKQNLRTQQPFRDKDWFTFSFVRNPFARLVSCYESKYHEDKTRNSTVIKRGFLDFDYYLNGYMRQDKGFAHFIKQVNSIPNRLANSHFRSQYYLLVGKDGKPVVDFIGKVERIDEDYDPIRKKYGYDLLRHYNKAKYGDWRDYYTTTLAKKVYRKFKKDVLYFGYEQEYRDLLEYCAKKE